MKVYYDADTDPSLLSSRTIAIVGYGNQGHAHALCLRDSGANNVIVGARDLNSTTARSAADAGFEVIDIASACSNSDIVMLLAPDEHLHHIYQDQVANSIRPGAALGFAHGFAIHFGTISPRSDIDIFLVAPKGPGHGLRAEYKKDRGLAALFGVHQDVTGNARSIAMAYAAGLGCGRAGMIETSFGDECESDLFGEQAVLCGGIVDLIFAGYDTLVEAGYEAELAYFECLHEVKLIIDLMIEGGPAHMRRAISNTAEYGGYLAGRRLVTQETRAEMRQILDDVRSGRFARAFIADADDGNPDLRARRAAAAKHSIEDAGRNVRSLMPWLSEDQLKDE